MLKDENERTYTLTGTLGDLVVEFASEDQNNWYTERMEKLPMSKEEYITEAVKTEFPNIIFKDYSELQSVLSRSKALSTWYRERSAEWVKVIEVPNYLLEVVHPDVYRGLVGKVNAYNNSLAIQGKAIKIEADLFQQKIRDISLREQKVRSGITKDGLVKVITMGSQEMPISLQLEIERYTPKDGDEYQQRRQFSREILYCYQKALATGVYNNTITDVTAFIEGLAVK
jgi:hypothetical protein